MQPLEIIYRDQWLIAVDKPAGMLVHAGRYDGPADLIVQKLLRDQIGHRVNSLHRLDRPTSGVLLFSISSQIDSHMRDLFDRQAINKTYVAVVSGTTKSTWSCEEDLKKDIESPALKSETDFHRIAKFDLKGEPFSALEAKPKTGRFHQIRKHLAHCGYPIIGDYRYGQPEMMKQLEGLTGVSRLMLHASSIEFCHPINSEDIYISAPLPAEFSIG